MGAMQLALMVIALALLLSYTTRGANGANCFSAIYSFGDSLTDTGNTVDSNPILYYPIDSLPYGETYFGYPTGRCSDGRLVIDFLADSLGFSFLPPFLTVRKLPFQSRASGLNFAVAGGTALDPSLLNSKHIVTLTELSLDVEIEWFQELKEATCSENFGCEGHFSKALYVMGEMGANDYLLSILSSKTLPEIETLIPLVVPRIQAALEALINQGAQYILVQGMPPLGCIPSVLKERPSPPTAYDANGCLVPYNQLAQNHNAVLQQTLQNLSTKYEEATLIYHDYYSLAVDIYTNHTSFGFTETVKACCGSGGGPYNFDLLGFCGTSNKVVACKDPSTYTSWDGIHPTEAAYLIAANSLSNPKYTHPTLEDLITKSCS